MKVKNDHRSKFSERRNLKKSGLQRDSNPWRPRIPVRCLPTELWSHTLGARSINWVHIFPWGVEMMGSIYELFHIYFTSFHSSREDMNSTNWPRSQVWLHSSVGRASHRYRGGHGFESRWSPDFFQASSFQLLKFSNFSNWKELLHVYCTSFHSSREDMSLID